MVEIRRNSSNKARHQSCKQEYSKSREVDAQDQSFGKSERLRILVRPGKMEGLDATFLPVVEQPDAVMREFSLPKFWRKPLAL
jgi:hypothetical protein